MSAANDGTSGRTARHLARAAARAEREVIEARAARAAARARSAAARAAAPRAAVGAAAGAAAGGSGAMAGAAPAVSPYFVFFTDPDAEVERGQGVFRVNLAESWRAAVPAAGVTRTKLTRAILRNSGYCLPNVSAEYVAGQVTFERNPILFTVSTDASASDAVAFILARFIAQEGAMGMYLDVICANKELRIGHALITFFHDFSWDHGVNFIKLSSLANVLVYYRKKHGYEFRTTCRGAPLTDLSPALNARDFRARPAPEETSAAYSDKDFMDFMYDTLYKTHDLGVRAEEGCKIRPASLTRVQFKRADCAQDGFTMMKCTRGGGGRKTRRNRRARRSTRRN